MLGIIAIITAAATYLGGLFALRFKDRLHLILGFSAGAVVGVAFFDLLPESLALGAAYWNAATITSTVALGFVAYLFLDRAVLLHAHEEDSGAERAHRGRGALGAASLSTHSFLDGVAIGLAYQVSAAVGAVVAVAVIVHDFSDGINTVNMVLKSGGTRGEGLRWLAADALAPIFGILSTLFFTLSEQWLSIILAIFCGFFLYIGASDLLPESHHRHKTVWTTAMTMLGIAVLFIAIRAANA